MKLKVVRLLSNFYFCSIIKKYFDIALYYCARATVKILLIKNAFSINLNMFTHTLVVELGILCQAKKVIS